MGKERKEKLEIEEVQNWMWISKCLKVSLKNTGEIRFFVPGKKTPHLSLVLQI